MNITINIYEFDLNNIYYLDPIKNTVIENSNFIRLLYSNNIVSLNGIYILLNFKNVSIINNNNKIRYCFEINNLDNINTITLIKNLENDLLKNSIIKNKRPFYKLKDQLNQGYIKIFNFLFMHDKYLNSNLDNDLNFNLDNNENFILKISGIWESDNDFGLTYKILKIKNKLTIGSKKL
tara:strand:- start:136 stop:672 length:537 start_codon:yes stop_codon:yes gene_type:complete